MSCLLAGTAVADIMPLVGWRCAGEAQRYIGVTPTYSTTKRNESGRVTNRRTWTQTSCPHCQSSRNYMQLSQEETSKVQQPSA